jgi:hypothetical protein
VTEAREACDAVKIRWQEKSIRQVSTHQQRP